MSLSGQEHACYALNPPYRKENKKRDLDTHPHTATNLGTVRKMSVSSTVILKRWITSQVLFLETLKWEREMVRRKRRYLHFGRRGKIPQSPQCV